MARISCYYAVGIILLLLSLTGMPALGETGTTLIVGGDQDFPPYEFLKNGEPTGFNIDLTRAVAETMGLNIEIRLSEWSLTKQNLKDGSIDIIAGMVYSDERGKQFAFSLPHTMISPVLFVRNESAYFTYNDISGKEIIVEQDDIMHDFLKSQAFASQIIAVSSLTEALRLLSSGKHDAALISSEIYKYYITSKQGFSNLREIKTNLPSQNYCFAVAKENRALLHTLDRGLIRLKSTGEYQQIYNKWFGIYEQKRWWDSFKYIIFVLLLAIIFFIISLFWSWTLKKTVQAQTAELRENEKELQTAQAKLEKRVEERTADLAFANTQLNDEIRERQKIEEALRDSEAKYRAIVEAFDGQIYICSPDFRIEYMNQRLIERTGYDATGERCYKVLHERNSICPWCINEKILQGKTVRWEMQSPKDNRWYYIVNTPIYHSQGKVSKQAMILDITDRVEAEKEKQKLEEKNRQLQKIKSLDRMAGAIAHHFNNKLHVVKGQMDLALQAISNKNKTTQHIKKALQEADKAADVSRLMLTYLGKANHPKDTIDLSEVCKKSINQIQTDMPSHIKLDLALPSPGPAIIGNANQIQLLLSNIIRNSLEAIGKDKGTIQLHVKIVSAKDISSAQRFPIDWQPQEKE